jgi:hypothetical protein
MARSPALIEAVMATTGESKAAVSVALARLRAANLVPVTGRGPYAIPMDSQAAMRLLLAVCASVPLEPQSARVAVGRFEHLPSRPPVIEPADYEEKGKSHIMPLDELPEEHTLGEALKRLIEAGGADELFTYVDPGAGNRRKGYMNPDIRGYLKVEFMLPIPQVRIEHQFSGWLRKTWVYGHQPPIALQSYNEACRSSGLGDRARMTMISGATIEEIGRVLRT